VKLSALPQFASGNRCSCSRYRALVKISEDSRHLARLLIDRRITLGQKSAGLFLWNYLCVLSLPGCFWIIGYSRVLSRQRATMDAATQNLCPVTLESVGNSPDMQLPQTRVMVVVQVAFGLPPAASLPGAPPTAVCSPTGANDYA